MVYLSAKDVSNITGVSIRKAQAIVREAAKIGKRRGGVYIAGKAPARVLEEMLLCDLSNITDAGGGQNGSE